MQFTVKRPVPLDIPYVLVDLPVRYGTEDIPADFPKRSGDRWIATIAIDTGKILDWPPNYGPYSLEMKVVDEGRYALLDENGQHITTLRDYVPHGLIPGSYGDYVELEIDATGTILNWPTSPDVSAFFNE